MTNGNWVRISRRDLVKAAFAAGVIPRVATAADTTLWFVDGYHGGVRGHMPAGAWRDIVTRLASTPDWKLCLDIEPASWRVLAEQDPESYARLARYLDAPKSSPRIEMVGGTFAQPYGWAITGESNIRQLLRGLEVIHESFPDLSVDTYAMQEPCWASCLPQILVSLGFKAAVLKNPSTAWGGYSAGMDAETVDWKGPDGTAIRTVPRYACEELLDTWRTEAQAGSRAFAEKCVAHGIAHPAGMCFQDLGWAARPNIEGEYVRFVTWREYMRSVAGPTARTWRFGIEDIRCSLPWGEKTLNRIARQVRSAENRLIASEKVAAMAAVRASRSYPAGELRTAWDKTLWAQHHDAWITATTRRDRDAWAFQVAAETWDAESACVDIAERSLKELLTSRGAHSNVPVGETPIHVFNTLAQQRTDLVELEFAADPDTRNVRVLNSAGDPIPSQFKIQRKYSSDAVDRVSGGKGSELKPGESIAAGQLLFRASVPPTGDALYRIETSREDTAASPGGATAAVRADGMIAMETDLYRVLIDPSRGGIVSSLHAKELNKEFCAPGERLFHEFRGYFIEQKEWISSASSSANVRIMERGPLRASVVITGQVSGATFQTTITLAQGRRRIDFQTQFEFEKDTWIGDPWEIPPARRMTERRRSEYDGRYKLLALFPVAFSHQTIWKNAAFDVCRSSNADTFFNRWDDIKHDIILNWVDLMDEDSGVGLALFSDHTTSYVHGPDHPLALVLGWGADGGFWWGRCPLRGALQANYALVPHSGNWRQAGLWRETAELAEPLLSQLGGAARSSAPSLVTIEDPGVQLSAMLVEGRDLVVRLFNAESEAEMHTVRFGVKPNAIEVVELDGRRAVPLGITDRTADGCRVRIQIPRFGLRTIRLRNVAGQASTGRV